MTLTIAGYINATMSTIFLSTRIAVNIVAMIVVLLLSLEKNNAPKKNVCTNVKWWVIVKKVNVLLRRGRTRMALQFQKALDVYRMSTVELLLRKNKIKLMRIITINSDAYLGYKMVSHAMMVCSARVRCAQNILIRIMYAMDA